MLLVLPLNPNTSKFLKELPAEYFEFSGVLMCNYTINKHMAGSKNYNFMNVC